MSALSERYLRVKRALFDRYYQKLNQSQREAIYQTENPLLVLAGAGSGKTTVLVRRIAHIIRYGNAYHADTVPPTLTEDDVLAYERALNTGISGRELEDLLTDFAVKPCPAWCVMAITFTNKAANEIKERLAAAFPDDDHIAADIWAGTFHSICMRILRRHPVEAGLKPGFTVYDTEDSKKAMQAVLKSLDIDEKLLPVKQAMNLISRAKDRLISPADFVVEMGNDFRMKQVAKVYEAYQARLAESNALDFDDIIFRTVLLFQNHSEILDKYKKRFTYIAVDEYQDTNEAQFKLTYLLSAYYTNIMAVGDDDQSIYKFRGATIENIRNFTQSFASSKMIRLEQNYRSTQNILDAANAVIAHNPKSDEMRKTLFTDRGQGSKIRVLTPDDQNAEARAIVDIIRNKVAAGEAAYRDFAVLFRANAQSNALESVFARSGIPYRMLGGTRFSDRKEIRDIVAYLQLIVNHEDKERLLRIVNEPRRKIGDKTLAAVEEIANAEGCTMLDVMGRAASYVALSRSANALMSFAALIDALTALLPVMSLDDFVNEVLDRTGYRQMLIDGGEPEKDRLDNIEEFVSGVIEYMKEAEEPTLVEFLQINTLVADVDRYDDTADAVVMMTIHSAKGLEFPQVFLPGFEEGIFPSMATIMGGPDEIEEERRLAYVAITRAKNELCILHTKSRLLYGRTSANPASRFLGEIPDALLDRPRVERPAYAGSAGGYRPQYASQSASASRIGVTAPTAPRRAASATFAAGDRVRHATFGEGLILSVQKIAADTLYEIAFDTKGTKKLMATYAKLEKI